MALTKEGVASLKDYIATMRSGAEGTRGNDSPEGVTNDQYNQNVFDKMTESTDYAAWVNGTEFGAKFEENLQKLKAISFDLRAQYVEIINKLDAYVELQDSINAGGGK